MTRPAPDFGTQAILISSGGITASSARLLRIDICPDLEPPIPRRLVFLPSRDRTVRGMERLGNGDWPPSKPQS
jgi:hypothetical protein